DSKQLKRWTRRTHGATNLRPLQLAGVVLGIIGLGGFIPAIADGMSVGLAAFVSICATVGILCYRLGRYREQLALPVPDFAVLKSAWQNKPEFNQERAKQMEFELRS